RENQLRPERVCRRAAEHVQQVSRQSRVQARVDLVEQQESAGVKSSEGWADQLKPRLSAVGLLVQRKCGGLAARPVYEMEIVAPPNLVRVLLLYNLYVRDPRVGESQQVQRRAHLSRIDPAQRRHVIHGTAGGMSIKEQAAGRREVARHAGTVPAYAEPSCPALRTEGDHVFEGARDAPYLLDVEAPCRRQRQRHRSKQLANAGQA